MEGEESQRSGLMDEHEVGRRRSAGNFDNYYDDDNRKLGLVFDYAYYMERYCTRTEGHRRTSEELAEGGQSYEEEPAVVAAAAAVVRGDETDTDCKNYKN